MNVNEKECFSQYETLLKSGELKELFPRLSGKWERDRNMFMTIYEDNQKILDMDIIIEDDDEFYERIED